MKVLKGFLLFMVLLIVSVKGFSVIIEPVNFPYKGLVFDGLNIPAEDRYAITQSEDAILTDEVYNFIFVYDGKKYEAELYIFGAMLVHVYESDADDAAREASYWYCFTVSDFQGPTIPIALPVAP